MLKKTQQDACLHAQANTLLGAYSNKGSVMAEQPLKKKDANKTWQVVRSYRGSFSCEEAIHRMVKVHQEVRD